MLLSFDVFDSHLLNENKGGLNDWGMERTQLQKVISLLIISLCFLNKTDAEL